VTERSQDPQPGSPAEELFADWLASRQGAEPEEFDALCRRHPEHEAELRRLHSEWRRIDTLLRKAGLGVAPTAGESLARKLAEQYGSGVDLHVSLHEEGEKPGEPPTSQLLERLRSHALKSTRYRLHGEIARGGMGAILKVWDEDLRRSLAMKVILGKAESSGGTPPVDRRLLARFLEEAQVTGQLDHPGIVPVHELGLDAEGRVYFTMKLVKGRDLKQIFELAIEEQEGWNETRALGVILKVCEAMAYAHKKGVIHRDLKPANVMVGGFGEVFVMDWGLARVLGQKDTHDLRLQPLPGSSSLKTERREERQDAPDSPLFTMDGDVVGTPCYMPPEQARGEIEKLSARSDVYSIGAMLYHLLARQMPYCPPDVRVTNRTVLGLVLHGPPAPIENLRKGVPAELVAICEKAMAREASARYADTQALAEDLRAYLEGRVVRAYETGAWAETRKWIQRNKPLAAALAGVAALLIGGLTTSLVFKARADERAADLQAANTTIQSRNTELAAATRAAMENERLAKKSEQFANEKERESSEKAAALRIANLELGKARDKADEQAYIANIIAADASLRSDEVPEAKRRLEACDERLRGWEWRYLHLASDTSFGLARARLQNHLRLFQPGRDARPVHLV
jgi:serine/threonine protein kinase